MKLINSNDYLTTEVLSGRKHFSEYMFLKKFLQDCSNVIIQKSTANDQSRNIIGIFLTFVYLVKLLNSH